MLLESYRAMIEFYRNMSNYLKTLKSSKIACNTVIEAMQEFSYGKVSFADEVDKFKNMVETADTLDEVINGFEKAIIQVESELGKVEGIDAKVIYMRDVEKKPLYEIAKELGYSYDYIREVSSRNPKTTHN